MTLPSGSKSSRVKSGGAGLAMLAVATVGGHEGLKLTSYLDIVGVPTVCYGETRGIKMGMKFTKPECDALLVKGLDEFAAGIERCVPVLADAGKVRDKTYVAHLSLAYNIGVGAYCNSSAARLTKAGLYADGCDAFLKWRFAGGLPVLLKRRQSERALCREGL